MSSITIFPCPFTPAGDVARTVTDNLGLEFVDDDQLLTETALHFDTDREKLERVLNGRTSVFNAFTLEREKRLNQLKQVLATKLVGEGQYLIYGLASALVPRTISHVLKVALVAPREERLEYASEHGRDVSDAKRELRSEDVKAYELTDLLYQKEAYDSSLYDLFIPIESRSAGDLAELVSHYFRTTPLLQTEQSMQVARDMFLEAMVEDCLLAAGHKLDIRVTGGEVFVDVVKSVFNFDKLERELVDLIGQVESVRAVHVKQSYSETSIYRQQDFNLPSRVLFVDDEKEFVHTVSERLISRDVGTYGVYNGEEALSVVQEDRPDVMVLDLKMPGLHGVEVLRQTKELAPEVEVIILTGHGTSQDMQDCMTLGAFAYLTKPVDIEELSRTIQEANQKVKARSMDSGASG